jgi:hypothetical protein
LCRDGESVPWTAVVGDNSCREWAGVKSTGSSMRCHHRPVRGLRSCSTGSSIRQCHS